MCSHWGAFVCIGVHLFALGCMCLHWGACICIGVHLFALFELGCICLPWGAFVCNGVQHVGTNRLVTVTSILKRFHFEKIPFSHHIKGSWLSIPGNVGARFWWRDVLPHTNQLGF